MTDDPAISPPLEVTAAPSTRFGELPYGPTMTRLLEPMHGAFLRVNRWVALPVLRAGLGPVFSTPLTGSLMILRTTGRKSGARREIPLGYAIADGNVYCIAGFGPETQWFKNILANPEVEVVLPLGAISGTAEEVTDPADWASSAAPRPVTSAASRRTVSARWVPGCLSSGSGRRESGRGPRIPAGSCGSRCRSEPPCSRSGSGRRPSAS